MKSKLLLIYYVIVIPLLVGLYFHRSYVSEIFTYSKVYFMFLISISLLMLIGLPLLFRLVYSRIGGQKMLFAIIPSILFCLLVYFCFHYFYYATKQHQFDPFVQAPPHIYNRASIPDNSFVILALGGSTTNCGRLNREEGYIYQLEQKLNQNSKS